LACRPEKVVAKMDATQNDVNSVEITGFPTLILFPRETNKKLEFSGQYLFSSSDYFM
jgi:hypothetical protein